MVSVLQIKLTSYTVVCSKNQGQRDNMFEKAFHQQPTKTFLTDQ